MINYYFHQISSFYCFKVLMYYAVLITCGTYRSLVTPLWQDRLQLNNIFVSSSLRRLTVWTAHIADKSKERLTLQSVRLRISLTPKDYPRRLSFKDLRLTTLTTFPTKYPPFPSAIGYPVNRAYFNVQLITICAVVKSKMQCQMCVCCIVFWPTAMFCAVCKSCLKYALPVKSYSCGPDHQFSLEITHYLKNKNQSVLVIVSLSDCVSLCRTLSPYRPPLTILCTIGNWVLRMHPCTIILAFGKVFVFEGAWPTIVIPRADWAWELTAINSPSFWPPLKTRHFLSLLCNFLHAKR